MCTQSPVFLACLTVCIWSAFRDVHVLGVSIVGGKEIKAHSKPWMASIQRQHQHICGGILIQDQWILTAAHCKESFSSLEDMTVLLGAHSLKNQKHTIRMGIEHCKIPHTFSVTTKADDIMLIKLKAKVKVKKEKVKEAKLPKSYKDIPPQTKCQVVGWGITKPKDMKASDTLQGLEVTIMDRDYCNCLYNSQPVITEDMLCAGNKMPQLDACQGDSGGPLECKKNIVGLVSGGAGCGNPKKPGVYTRFSKKHMAWINNIIKGQSNSTILHGQS